MVQTGINYVNQNIDYTSNVIGFSQSNQKQLIIPEYAAMFDANSSSFTNGALSTSDPLASVTTTDPFTINSAIELISIPMQAGFLLVDRKVGWQLNSGFSSDIFLRNTVHDQSGLTERLSQSAGKGSPYRSVNWTGLLNTEVSYRIGTNYRISLVPGVRYYFTSILKESSSTPVILDIGFRFKYYVK